MRRTGFLRTWHDDRGFGFITPTDGGPELFVHISEFPRDGSRPSIGEMLSFEVGPGNDGKQQAIRIQRRTRDSAHPHKSATKRPISLAIFAVVLIAAGVFLFFTSQSSQTTEPQTGPVEASTIPEPRVTTTPAASKRREPRALAPTPTSKETEPEASIPTVVTTTPEPRVSSPYRCDGRTRCSEMNSCAEAKFFLRNCPGARMDGDNDGVPCEQQWCTDQF
jgi:cold shock CspA family protein